MSKTEFLKLAEAIKTAYPKERLLATKEAMQLWYAMLQDIDYQTAAAAVKAYIALKKFPPTIADIREMVTPKQADWSDAWGEVQNAIRRYGYNRPDEALASMSDKTKAIVKRFGWQEICTSENLGVLRGQFRTAYEAATKYDIAQLPESLRKELESDRRNTRRSAQLTERQADEAERNQPAVRTE